MSILQSTISDSLAPYSPRVDDRFTVEIAVVEVQKFFVVHEEYHDISLSHCRLEGRKLNIPHQTRRKIRYVRLHDNHPSHLLGH
jgi:hypothetical protein